MLKSFAGGRLFGGTWGSGVPDVLALHGWQRTHVDFTQVFEEAGPANGARVGTGSTRADIPDSPRVSALSAGGLNAGGLNAVALDLAGFGASPPPPEPWGARQYAEQVATVFDESDGLADKVVLVGHSFGGRVAVHLCSLVPDRIERVVLTGVPLLDREGRRSRPPMPFRVGRRLHRAGLVSDARMEAMRNKYGSADYRAAQGVIRGVLVNLLSEDYTEQMAAISCPVDLVWGADDTEVPVEVAERARDLFPSAVLVTLPGVGHLTPTEAPEQLRQAIRGRTATGESTGDRQ